MLAKWLNFTFFLSLIMTSTPLWGQAENGTNCYRFLQPETPISSTSPDAQRAEIWCYQNFKSGLFIYNADDSEVRAETSLYLDSKGIITHGVLVSGELSLYRILAVQFNPYSIPLSEPRGAPRARPNEIHASADSARQILELLKSEPSLPIERFALTSEKYSAYVPTERIPWRGYWWPYAGRPLSAGANSPLAKYDRIVSAQTGSNPGARAWENSRHYYKGINWEGHCNGWVASAILRKEPTQALRDPVTGLIVSVSDQKGILSERDYCASTAFYGRRYRGQAGNDISDIYPALFHKVIVYYIGFAGKPVAIDYRRDSPVENHIITGYSMEMERTGPRTVKVTAQLEVRKYDRTSSWPPGPAPSYTRTYRYVLREDSNGQIISGYWLSENPDFLWVPLSSPRCKSQNPNISEAWTVHILNLPPANP